jgi:hypothetical protein
VIQHIDAALESFIRDVVRIPPQAADVVFTAPVSLSASGLARPAFVLHLWHVSIKRSLQRGGFEEETVGNRQARRSPTPILTCRYFATVIAGEPRDQHALLGSLLSAVLTNDKLPQAILPPPLQGFRIGLELAGEEHSFPSESAESSKGRFGLSLELAVPAEVAAWTELGAPVETVVTTTQPHRVASSQPDEPPSTGATPTEQGWVRRRRDGSSTVMEVKPASAEDSK